MDPLLILFFVLLFMLSAFFSGTELALMSLPSHKVDSLVKNKKFGSKSLKKIKQNSDRLLITILIGNNLVNTFTASFATSIAITVAKSGGLGIAESTAIGISTGIITFLLLLFGEIIPKSIATKNASSISLLVAPIYKILMIILYPIISFMEILIKVFSGKEKLQMITGEEIESFIDMGKQSGGIEDHEHGKIKSILQFDETIVEEIMTPRVKIDAISDDCTIEEAVDYYLEHTHTRLPVYSETIDRINFFITGKDLIKEYKNGNGQKLIKDLKLRKVLKVPSNQTILKLFDTFQNSNKVMAILIDEYGGVSGLATIEDIIEQVFGEIRDETDTRDEEFVEIGSDTLRVESDVLVEDVLEKYELYLEDIGLDSKEFDGETLSYVITHILDGFPSNGEKVFFDILKEDYEEQNSNIQKQLCFKIIEIDNARIGKIDVKIIEKELED